MDANKQESQKKIKKGYICLHPLKLKSPLSVRYPKGMIHILGVFTSKREALKYGKEIQAVKYKPL